MRLRRSCAAFAITSLCAAWPIAMWKAMSASRTGASSSMARAIDEEAPVLDADMAFHIAIGQAAHNDVMANAAQLLRNLMKNWIQLKLMMSNVPAASLLRHREILAAIRARNADEARRCMFEH